MITVACFSVSRDSYFEIATTEDVGVKSDVTVSQLSLGMGGAVTIVALSAQECIVLDLQCKHGRMRTHS